MGTGPYRAPDGHGFTARVHSHYFGLVAGVVDAEALPLVLQQNDLGNRQRLEQGSGTDGPGPVWGRGSGHAPWTPVLLPHQHQRCCPHRPHGRLCKPSAASELDFLQLHTVRRDARALPSRAVPGSEDTARASREPLICHQNE